MKLRLVAGIHTLQLPLNPPVKYNFFWLYLGLRHIGAAKEHSVTNIITRCYRKTRNITKPKVDFVVLSVMEGRYRICEMIESL